MKKILYANGCSFTSGCELEGVGIPHSEYNLEHAWPKHLMKLMGFDSVVNQAVAGGSNDRIIRTSMSWLSNANPEETFVVIGWTDAFRQEIVYKDKYHAILKDFTNTIDNKRDYKYLKEAQKSYTVFNCDEKHNELIKIQVVILFQSFLKQMGIEYFFFDALTPVKNYESVQHLTKLIDEDRFFNPYTWPHTMLHYLRDRNFKYIEDPPPTPFNNHYREDGHIFWANALFQAMKERKLI